jgi:hypothetical protein
MRILIGIAITFEKFMRSAARAFYLPAGAKKGIEHSQGFVAGQEFTR